MNYGEESMFFALINMIYLFNFHSNILYGNHKIENENTTTTKYVVDGQTNPENSTLLEISINIVFHRWEKINDLKNSKQY
jgi:hypothetical protein